MILVIDNYDSFVHNLARYFRQLGQETHVIRNDKTGVNEIQSMQPDAIVISPGPCTPDEAGCSLEVVSQLGSGVPILGVCLGHQAIVQAFGGRIETAPTPVHGRNTQISHNQTGIFAGLPSPMAVGRYHSLIAHAESLPAELEPTAQTNDGIIMAVRHRELPIVGVQFHPESILTEHGYGMLKNFLQLANISNLESEGKTVP